MLRMCEYAHGRKVEKLAVSVIINAILLNTSACYTRSLIQLKNATTRPLHIVSFLCALT